MPKNDETPPMQEQVQQIPISELHPFEGHPFRVVDDEAMTRTVESISQFGVISPLLVRPDPDGGYEIISGHRRCHAAEQVGLETLPVIVREMDDAEAIITMVASNLQRDTILPSERAWAYKMKMDAIKHQGARTDLTSTQVVSKLAASEVGDSAGVSRETVRRYVRLTNLIPELMDMVDEKKIAFNPAVELSYLTRDEQSHLLEAMDYAQATPSLSQAQRLKKLSQLKQCTPEAMEILMDEVKKEELAPTVTLPTELLRKYFPKSYTPKQMEDTIIRLLDQWQKSRQRNQSR